MAKMSSGGLMELYRREADRLSTELRVIYGGKQQAADKAFVAAKRAVEAELSQRTARFLRTFAGVYTMDKFELDTQVVGPDSRRYDGHNYVYIDAQLHPKLRRALVPKLKIDAAYEAARDKLEAKLDPVLTAIQLHGRTKATVKLLEGLMAMSCKKGTVG